MKIILVNKNRKQVRSIQAVYYIHCKHLTIMSEALRVVESLQSQNE